MLDPVVGKSGYVYVCMLVALALACAAFSLALLRVAFFVYGFIPDGLSCILGILYCNVTAVEYVTDTVL